MHILFTRRYNLLDSFIETSAKMHEVYVYVEEQKVKYLNLSPEVRVVPQTYGSFGLGKIMSWLRKDISVPTYIREFKRNTSSISPDAIIAFDFFQLYFWQALFFARSHPNTRLILYSETRKLPENIISRWLMFLFLWQLRKNATSIDRVLVWTEEGDRFFKQHLPNSYIEVVPAPIDTSIFYPTTSQEFLPEGKLRIIMNARFIPLKRHTDLLNAAAILKKRKIPCSISFVGKRGHLIKNIQRKVDELGLSEDVHFLDPVPLPEVRNYYIEHDVLVLPSDREAIGMVVPEAMAVGLPTITSSAVGANSYVVEGETGFIFPVGDVEALADALEKCFDKETLKRMGRKASERIQQEYSLEQVTRKFIEILEK